MPDTLPESSPQSLMVEGDRRFPLPRLADASLVSFTLLIQSAVGLVFVGTLGHWLDESVQAYMVVRTTALALALTALSLLAALTHLAAPRRALQALRNPTTSWLSREVLLVPMFALALVFSLAAHFSGGSTTLAILEVTCLCLGAAALWAMNRVYHIKTVPVWNTGATTLEFMGSALLLGGALTIVLSSFGSALGWGAAFTLAVTGMCLGLLLKIAAIRPGASAERFSRERVWYALPETLLSAAQSRVLRSASTGLGVALILMGADTGLRTGLIAGLIVLLSAEVAGRLRFYRLYARIGL